MSTHSGALATMRRFGLLLLFPVLPLCVSGQEVQRSSGSTDAHEKFDAARASCFRAHGLDNPKVMRQLLPLDEKVPVPMIYADVTEPMLRLNRKPNSEEKAALHVYYDATLECKRSRAKAMSELVGQEVAPFTTDKDLSRLRS